ncbi:MAG: DinB family protein [Bacteroidota bacterium]|nr:DinB family protein [Bacteroidota bacterium]
MILKPNHSDAPSYYHYYFDLVKEEDLLTALETNYSETIQFMSSISKHKENYSYAYGKWTIKEVFRHIIDTEKILAYRAFRFSRFDNIDLAGFDENEYIAKIQHTHYDLKDLIEEFINLRKSTINMFKPMTEDMLNFKGTANNMSVTARGIGFMIVGHAVHHCQVVKSKYL